MHREPHLLIADDDPRVIDYYRLALGLPATPEEQDTDQELDEMFSLLEGEDPLQEHAPSHCSGYCKPRVRCLTGFWGDGRSRHPL